MNFTLLRLFFDGLGTGGDEHVPQFPASTTPARTGVGATTIGRVGVGATTISRVGISTTIGRRVASDDA
jgi:hypothetical protein